MSKETKIVIVMAAGSGTRMGSSTPKQFLDLCGKPVLPFQRLCLTLERVLPFERL